ncbi:PH domain protein [Opisthorchis viverrini]|uniref:PH domain protein n=1 Tax=Opisthorchis viverrini TaxID=6198 RepID=A0A1S8X3L6_OPIVI|nr:PH domain protein [Opisthorchis viverrini]
MNYSNSSLDPEVLEFYCPNRSKNARCHAHHHTHQPHPQRLHGTHPGSHQQAQPGAYRHSQPVCSNAGASQSQSSAHNTSKTYHGAPQHAPPQHAQQRFGASEHFHHHSGHRYRSSISPVQALPSTCGSSVSTLNSSSGYCTAGSTAHSVGVSSVSSRKTHLRARDHVKLLREKIALLPGGRSRQGGPLLCFPSNSRAHDIPYDDLCLLVCYLTYLPDESVKKAGFSVIVDMRNGTTWNNVKPILRAVEQCVVPNVAITYIIKPDNFFEKHKANMQIGKFNFEIQLVSLATLFREVDPSQLTAELEGTLPYHHEEWIKIRCCVEEFFFSAQDMMDQFGHLFNLLKRKPDLDTVERAKLALEEHRSLRSKIVQAPVSAIEAEADRLTTWLLFGMTAATVTGTNAGGSQSFPASTSAMNAAGAGGASFLSTSWVSMNPDFQKLIPQVRRTFTTLNEFRTHLQQKWEDVRSHLEQIYQLRLFEEDANRMATWLGQRRHLFLTEHVDIGQTACHAADLLAEHRQFVEACSAAFDTVARLNGVARILADVGHFASQQILKQAAQIEHEWKSFVSALEDRSQVLCLSASFHARAQAFLANCPNRATAMQQVNGNTVHELNQALLTLQNYWQEAQTAHMEVCVDGKALTDHLSAPVPTGSHTSLTAAVDYSQGRKHCTDLVHEIWDRLKLLERVYNERRTRLNSRLTLLMFKEDVGQVLAWLTEHGEPFLHRQTAVGKSIQRAEQLYNTHMQFEQVAATTLLNAEKLISVADELAAQADDPEEVLQRANELLTRISAFTQAVEARRETVDLGCGFYNHTKEVIAWLHAVKESHNTGEHLPATIEGMEDELTNFHRDRSAIEEGADRVATEGETLISRLKDTEEVTHIRSVLAQVASERSTVSALLMERQVRLDLCLQLRLFEADVNSALDCLRHGIPSFSQLLANRNEANSLLNATATTQSPLSTSQFAWLADPRQAPDIASLEELSSIFMSVLPAAEEVLNKGGELIRAFESLGVNFPAGGPGSSDSGVGDSAETAMERVHRLSNELAEVVTFVDELNEKINGELEWRRLEQQSKQVLLRISQCEDMMRDTAIIPANLSEAQSLQTEHEKFQPVLNEAHPRAVQCASKASLLLHQTANYSSSSGLLSSSTGGSSAMEHPRRKDFRAVGEAVTEHWQKLVYAAEDRHKLLVAATNWYKTSDQVTSVLWSLEKEYRREEDWCQNEKAMSDTAGYLNQLSMKHAEQKEAFLKACMLARRTSDLFSRYLHRQSPTTPGRKEVEEKMRTAMSELMAKEQAVLEAWAVRRRRLDDCIYFINIKGRVEELLTRVQQQSSLMHSPSKDIGMTVSSQLASSLCQEVNRACESLESMIAASMPLSPGHTTQLRSLLKRLQSTLPQPSPSTVTAKLSISGQDVSQKPQGEQRKLSAPASVASRLDIAPRPKRPDTDTDRTSVSSTSSSGAGSTSTGASDVFLGSGSAASATGPTQEQRRMIRRRENLLHELIQTERSYVQALEQCLATYKQGLLNPPSWPELKGLPDDLPIHSLGDVILQDQFTVWEPKQLIKKSRERRVFLFDNCLILAKEASTQPGEHKAKSVRMIINRCLLVFHIVYKQRFKRSVTAFTNKGLLLGQNLGCVIFIGRFVVFLSLLHRIWLVGSCILEQMPATLEISCIQDALRFVFQLTLYILCCPLNLMNPPNADYLTPQEINGVRLNLLWSISSFICVMNSLDVVSNPVCASSLLPLEDRLNILVETVPRYFNLTEPLPSYLIKPVQRVTKYQLLLRELRDCCDPASVAELNEGLEAMLDVPKRANDALHLSMLHGLPDDLPIHSLGDVILQDQFTVWEPKQLIKKSRERRVFLFDNCLILAKEASTQPGEHKAKSVRMIINRCLLVFHIVYKQRYHYKSRLLLAECNITEHIEGDQCKFALWTGRVPPIHEYRMVLKASSLDLKQTWVRALREGMRERMFSVQSLYQHHQQSASTGKTGVLSEDAELLDTHYILENYQASRPNELSVSAHQIVQVLHRCDTPNLPLAEPGSTDSGDASKSVKLDPHASGEWAYIRMLVQGTGTTTTTQSPIKEGFIPARLIGAPSGRRSSTTRNRSANASGRRWLLPGSDVRRGAGSGLVPGKRGSKADLNQTQGFPTPYPTATPRVLSTDRQPPKLNATPVDIGSTILDNVSEESIDVELPPPMTELQVLPTTTQPELAATEQTLEDAHKVQDDGDVASSKTAVVVESNGRSSAEQIPEDDVLRKSPQVQHRLATVAEVAGDGRIDMSNVPSLVGLPVGANLSGLGDLRLHGGLNVAAKLVAGPRPVATGSQSTVGPDEEMLRGVFDEGAELHFVSRYLFLYDQALVIADAAVELLPTDEETSPTLRKRLQCQFRHALPISQISIMEDVGAPGSKPTSEQLLWFCLSERARTTVSTSPLDSAGGGGNHSNSPPPPSSAQSYLCYVVAPRSPDTRVRWLTELTAMVMEARRLSQAFATSSPLEGSSPNGDAGLLMHSKLTSAAAVALYPSGMLFDQSLMELPKLGLIQVGSLNPGSRWKVTPTSSSSLSAPKSSDLPSFLEGLHLTATSSA